jgi:hypothetical protein
VPGVPSQVQAALFLVHSFDQVLDPGALDGQVSAGPERPVREFSELRGHGPPAEFSVGHHCGAIADPPGKLHLAEPGRVPNPREQAARFPAAAASAFNRYLNKHILS